MCVATADLNNIFYRRCGLSQCPGTVYHPHELIRRRVRAAREAVGQLLRPSAVRDGEDVSTRAASC